MCLFTSYSVLTPVCAFVPVSLWLLTGIPTMYHLLPATLADPQGRSHVSPGTQVLARRLASAEEMAGVCCALNQGQSQNKGHRGDLNGYSF